MSAVLRLLISKLQIQLLYNDPCLLAGRVLSVV